MRKTATLAAAIFLIALTTNCNAQRNNKHQSSQNTEKIAWYSTLDSARAEAALTERPILLIAARPECQGVPGKW